MYAQLAAITGMVVAGFFRLLSFCILINRKSLEEFSKMSVRNIKMSDSITYFFYIGNKYYTC